VSRMVEFTERYDGARSRRVLAGEGLVTPVREVEVNGERLQPKRDRLALDHPWVLARPELFRCCVMVGDRFDTPGRHRRMLAQAERALTGTTTTRIADRSRPLVLPRPQPHRPVLG
jgi:hypothetical protein